MASVDGSKTIHESSDDGPTFDCSPCDYEGVKKEAKFYCPQCQDYLCDSCKVTHQKFSSTRKHQVVSGILKPTKHRDTCHFNEPRAAQCICSGNDMTIYCKDHNDVMCMDCKTLKHRNCKTTSVDEVCDNVDATYTDATKEQMEALRDKLEEFEHRRQVDAENLFTKTADCRDKVEEFKRELIKNIEDLVSTTLDDIAKCDSDQRTTIVQHLDACATALKRMEIEYKPLKEVEATGIKSLIFIHDLKLKKTLEQVDDLLNDIGKDIEEPFIAFVLNETLRANINSLGVVRREAHRKTETKDLAAKQFANVKDMRPVIGDMKIKTVEKIDVQFPGDKFLPFISGSLFMPNGELILSDWSNCSLKALNNTYFTQKEQLNLSSAPWDLCLVEADKIVITQPLTKSLLFMKVVPRLKSSSSISLDQKCRGVAVQDGFIYVSFESGEIRILDRTGQQQRNVYSGFSFQTPYYISVTPTGMVYVSEHGVNNIRGLTDGKETTNLSDVGIVSPMGVYIDGENNILVCEQFSHNLKLIDAKGLTSKVLYGTEGLHSPCTVSVRPTDNTLIVGGKMQTLVVCKMVVS